MSDIKTTEEVLGHHLQSFGKGSVDDLLEDFTDESVVITPTDTLVGLDAIRPLFEEFVTNMLPPGCSFEMIKQEIKDDVAFIAWKAESDTYNFPFATDTFVIKDGKIRVQTFAGQIEKKG